MRDLIDARLWDEHGHQFSEDLHRFFPAAKVALQRLGATRFAVPWRNVQASREQRGGPTPNPVRVRLAAAAFSALLTTLVAGLALGSGLAAAQPGIA